MPTQISQKCSYVRAAISSSLVRSLTLVARAMARVCSQCGVEMPPSSPARINKFVNGMLMCSRECGHAAGSRSICGAWCGCTGYTIKRRLLRKSRVQMRIMDSVIRYHDLEEEVDDLLVEETGNTGFLSRLRLLRDG